MLVVHRDDWKAIRSALNGGQRWVRTCGCQGSGRAADPIRQCAEHGCAMGCGRARMQVISGIQWVDVSGFCVCCRRQGADA